MISIKLRLAFGNLKFISSSLLFKRFIDAWFARVLSKTKRKKLLFENEPFKVEPTELGQALIFSLSC